MSDEKDGQAESSGMGAMPVAGAELLSGRTRTAPVIEGQAVEVPAGEPAAVPSERAEAVDKEAVEQETGEPSSAATPTESIEAGTTDASGKEPQPRSVLRAAGAVAALLALGAGGYYGWTEFGGKKAATDIFAASETAPPGPGAGTPADKQAETPAPAAASPPVGEASQKANEAPLAPMAEKESKAAEPAPAPSGAPGEKSQQAPDVVPDKMAETRAPVSSPVQTMKKAEEAPAATAPSKVEPSPAAPAPDKAAAAGGAEAETKLTQMAAQLAATQTTLEQVSQRLKAVEVQLAIPKTDARAQLAERDAGPANTGDASARVVAAQSLLAALRQGDDYSPMLAALQNLGGDPVHLARLRAGVTTPTPAKLAENFAALAPKIMASAAPVAQQPAETKPQGFGESAWAFLAVRLNKMVKVRPVGAPDQDAVASRIDRVEKDLLHNDIAGALSERAQLPASALSVTADWASAAQARLDAEEAAKAELAQSLQNLSKSKS